MSMEVFARSIAYPVPTNQVALRCKCVDGGDNWRSEWRDTLVVLDAAPLGSQFEAQVGSSLDCTRDGWTFTADKPGIYHFSVTALDAEGEVLKEAAPPYADETTTYQLEIGHRLTKQVGTNEDPPVAPATLVVFVWNDKVKATVVDADHPEYDEVTPRLDPYPSNSLSRAAVQNCAVVTAVSNLIERDVADIVSTYYAAVEAAYVAALAAPGPIATEHPGAVTLIDALAFK